MKPPSGVLTPRDEGPDEVSLEGVDEELADFGLPHSLAILPGKVAPLRGLV